MPLAEILGALRQEADEEVARISAERDTAVAAVSRAAREEAKRAEATAATSRDQALLNDADVIRHRADLHVERRLQEAREAVFQEILGRAKDRLSRYRQDPGYRATFESLLDECQAFLGTMEVVMVDPRDTPLMENLLGQFGSPQLQTTLECWGGVVAHDGKGVFVRNTLEERLSRAEADLRRRIGQMVPGLAGRSDSGVSL